MENVEIKKGGKLIYHKWDYDNGAYIEVDVTDNALYYLMENCVLSDDIALRDIFLLIKQDIGVYKIIINNYVEEIIEEGLNKESKKDGELEFLELYWPLEIDEDGISSFNFPHFHAKGYPLEKDNELLFRAGDRIPYSICFTPANDLIDLPIRLKNNVSIYEWDKKDPILECKGHYSLLHILYGVIWELSWMGDPDDRDAKKGELLTIAEEVKNAT